MAVLEDMAEVSVSFWLTSFCWELFSLQQLAALFQLVSTSCGLLLHLCGIILFLELPQAFLQYLKA
jgi:hypothetical protein